MTDAERRLWLAVRQRRLVELKIRRQVPIGPYVADFYCPDLGLVIEVDGSRHEAETDRPRTEFLEAQGLKVLRFWNSDILQNLEGVLETILAAAEARRGQRRLHRRPSDDRARTRRA